MDYVRGNKVVDIDFMGPIGLPNHDQNSWGNKKVSYNIKLPFTASAVKRTISSVVSPTSTFIAAIFREKRPSSISRGSIVAARSRSSSG